jgi:hypothetical protein
MQKTISDLKKEDILYYKENCIDLIINYEAALC